MRQLDRAQRASQAHIPAWTSKNIQNDGESMHTEIFKVSRRRLLLSWYIDFLFFMTLWGLLAYFLSPDVEIPFWVPYATFGVVRAVSGKYIGSIGYSFLGIDRVSRTVNPYIFERENPLTMLIGVLLILEGSKLLVRWTQLSVTEPVFGVFPDETTQIIIQIVYGIALVISGYWFLRLDIKGLYLGISVLLISAVSDVLSWKLWDPLVETMIVARREVQGRAVDTGEIELMQSLIPEGMLVVSGLVIIAMLFTYRRFK
jgi:hypothetical protein